MLLSKLYIDAKIINHKIAQKILFKLDIPYELVRDRSQFLRQVNNKFNSIKLNKKLLFLTYNKGDFLKKCPGTRHYNCCNYYVLHIGNSCFMDCSYCILQTYFTSSIMQFFVNFEQLESELCELFANNKILRVGTGEFTDSLIWEQLTGISKLLINQFSLQNTTALELKTKTVNIENLEKLNHNKKTILSWSINTVEVIKNEEKHTSTLSARLKAAAKCESWGYRLAFHFDPIIIYKGCKNDYKRVIKTLLSLVSPQNIVWISIGSFRFMSPLKPIIKERFPSSKIIYGEFIKGLDNKMRYFKSLRIELYKDIIRFIKDMAPYVCIYFCMEDEQVWQETMGFTPKKFGNLGNMLDIEVKKKCNLIKV